RHTRFSRDWSSDVCSSDLTLSAWTTIWLSSESVVKKRKSSPPSLILYFFLMSSTLMGKFLLMTFAFLSVHSRLNAGIVYTRLILKIRPGKSSIKPSEVNRWAWIWSLYRLYFLAIDLNAPAFVTDTSGS